ncbi:chitinase [Arthrobacter sp. UYEF3]|uniref:chitinase n=1 Tax=Arthrobacter sp. UYEF3 TaxID=1756365 RepID=UPI00339B592A
MALILAAVLILVSKYGAGRDVTKPAWFAGYADVTISPAYAFETAKLKDVMMAFIVASPGEPCAPSWGTRYSLDAADQALNLDNRIQSLKSRGGRVAISFGGSLNLELANSCRDESALKSAYRQVVGRYDPVALDFDIEGDNLLDAAAGERRANVIRELQLERGSHDGELEVWLTLPASPRGLTDGGVTAVDQMLAAGVQLAGVNVMTMNYGESRQPSQSMLEASTSAATAVHDQLSIVYQRAGINLSSEELWAKLGLTPMIGQNDLPGEVFDLAATQKLRDFALGKGVQRLSMWSLNRDLQCPDGAGPETASHVCSGVNQGSGQFSEILGGGLKGRMG